MAEQDQQIAKLEAEIERLQAERKGMIDENPGDAYWETAPHDELYNALLFQGGTTKALLQQTEEQQAEIEALKGEVKEAQTVATTALKRELNLKKENERLREILHIERQAISKRMNRVKKAASRLDSAIHGTVLDLEGE